MPKKKLNGITSFDYKHTHKYDVDENGNGWAYEAYHPKNKDVYHKHEVIRWVVQSAQSACYPNCEDTYGVKGVGQHIHHLEGFVSETQKKIAGLRAYKKGRKGQINTLRRFGKSTTLPPSLRKKIIDKNGMTYQCPPDSTEVTNKCRQVGIKPTTHKITRRNNNNVKRNSMKPVHRNQKDRSSSKYRNVWNKGSNYEVKNTSIQAQSARTTTKSKING